MLAIVCALVAAGLYWAAPPAEALRASAAGLARMPLATVASVVALAAGVLGAEMVRFVVIGRAIGVRVGARAALDATIANNFFSWITPGAALGDPAAIYMLGRRGVPWDAALLITYAKFATGFALILVVTCVLVALGLGPDVPAWATVPFASGTGVGAVLMLLLIGGAFFPDATRGLVDRVERRLSAAPLFARGLGSRALAATARAVRGAIERLSAFRRAGAPGALAIAAAHLAYYACFIGVLVVLAMELGASSLARTAAVATVYQGFLYVAPTPGASGIGEATAQTFFGDLVPGGGAFVAVVAFRTLTFYLHIVLGLVYLPFVSGTGWPWLRSTTSSEPGSTTTGSS